MNGNDFLCQVHQGYLWERQANERKAVYARSVVSRGRAMHDRSEGCVNARGSDEWSGAGSETTDFLRAWPKLFGR